MIKSIASAFLLLTLGLSSCGTKPTVIRHDDCEDILSEIDASDSEIIGITEDIFDSFKSQLKDQVHPDFIDSIYLGKSKGYSVDFIISSNSGIYAEFKPDSIKTINLYCTDLPCQLKCFYNYKKSDANIRSELIARSKITLADPLYYGMLKAPMINEGGWGTIYGNGTIVLPYPKLFIMGSDALFIVNELLGTVPSDSLSFKMGRFSYIFGGNNLDRLSEKTSIISRSLVRVSIGELVLNSPLFAKSQANDILRKMTEDIRKRLQANSNQDNYEEWESRRDYENLLKKAKELGIEEEYAQSIYSDESSKDKYGTFLFHYSSYNQFMWIWVAVNVFSSLIILILNKFLPHNKKLLVTATGALIVGLNSWIITTEKPEQMEVWFWILPLSVALINVWLAKRLKFI